MKYILSLLIILYSLTAIGQGTPTYQGNSTSITYNRGTVGALRMQLLPRGFYPFPTFDTLGTIWVDSANTRGLFYHNGTARIRMASIPYVDSVALSIEAGSVDSSIYSTVTRLADSLHDLRDYVDSNNTIIYGSISALYDTLPNYVDTAQLNDSLQAIKAAYVPYTGATDGINLGNHSYFADNGVYNSEMSPSYFGVQNDSSTQFSLLEYNQLAVTNSNTAKVMTVNANGLVFPDASIQTFAADSIKYSTKAWRQKGVDSVVALIPSSSTYVPYTGATTDVNLGTNNILTNSVRLSASPTGTLTNVGQLYFDATNVTPSIPLNANVTLQIGQEEHVRARNNTGVQINDGQVVYINSAQGNNPTIALANADSVNTSEVIGVATENIADNGTGFVTTYGTVNGVNTSAFNSGDALYLSATAGTITNVIPSPPHNVVKVGVALNSTNNGKILVTPTQAVGQDTTFAAPYNSNKVAPTQRAIGTYVRKIVRDTASALRTAINAKGSGTVTSIQLVGGTNVTITPTTAITTSGVYTISATSGGGGSPTTATSQQVLYKSGSDTLKGATRVLIDSTDGRLILARNVDTAAVSTPYNGGTKIVGTNRMGMSAVRLVDTVSIPGALQRAINAQSTSHILPLATLTYTNTFTIGGLMQTFGTATTEFLAYNSTIQNKGYNKIILTTGAPANSRAGIRVGGAASAPGLVCGNTKFSGGGGRGTFTFCLPTYDAVQAIYMGYSNVTSEPATEPSTFLNGNRCLGVGKDAADATFFFFHTSNVGGAPTKVNTGITPNIEDVYRLTVYIAPNSTYYMQLEVLSKTGTQTVVINPTTNIPPVNSKLVMMHYVNKLAAAGTVSLGIIQSTEEVY